VIDNIKLDATGGKTIQRLDPVSAKLVSTAAACTLEDAKRLAASSELSLERIPDETTILNFRRLLEKHELAAGILAVINGYLG
ncbi:hypothetical protein Q6253_30355, partial [Klebsiella quasipneumoniae]|nr:hypothetical protein [Klebsiella quasipneumoniae]